MLKKNLKQNQDRPEVCFLVCTSPGDLWWADRWHFGVKLLQHSCFLFQWILENFVQSVMIIFTTSPACSQLYPLSLPSQLCVLFFLNLFLCPLVPICAVHIFLAVCTSPGVLQTLGVYTLKENQLSHSSNYQRLYLLSKG